MSSSARSPILIDPLKGLRILTKYEDMIDAEVSPDKEIYCDKDRKYDGNEENPINIE